ncbi:F0F1 ATP synthase subunit B [Nitriliruptoraceae bacterium ZYF776]|nr:F0F1 ATP synthase subunit B [Profundirhabdus halotolerans]
MNANLFLAAADGADEGIVLLPDMAELIWGAVGFLLLLGLLAKFVFPKVNQILTERGELIQGRIEEAEAKLNEAETTKAEYEAGIADARGEANRIIEDAKTTAESLRRDIVAKAEDEAALVLEKARADAATERDRLLQDLRTQVGTLSVELASRIVERELDATTHQALVDEYIQNLSRSN